MRCDPSPHLPDLPPGNWPDRARADDSSARTYAPRPAGHRAGGLAVATVAGQEERGAPAASGLARGLRRALARRRRTREQRREGWTVARAGHGGSLRQRAIRLSALRERGHGHVDGAYAAAVSRLKEGWMERTHASIRSP